VGCVAVDLRSVLLQGSSFTILLGARLHEFRNERAQWLILDPPQNFEEAPP
jgi:hypothetical protein